MSVIVPEHHAQADNQIPAFGDEASETPAPRPRRLIYCGVGSAVALACLLAALMALSLRPFSSIDEGAHTSYALDVAHGQLPTMFTPVTPVMPGMFREPTYVANHPPLYYATVGLPLRLAVATGHAESGLLVARLLTVLFLAAAMVAMAWTVRLLAPGQPQLALVAPALVGVLPIVDAVSSQVVNDAAALATTGLVLALCVLILRRGLSRSRFIALAAACGAAALTRSSGLSVAAVAAVAVAIQVLRSTRHNTLGRWVMSLASAIGLLFVVGLAAGWFYVRNRHLYGDYTGARVALKMFPAPHLSVWHSLASGHFWLGEYRQLFTRSQYLTGVLEDAAQAIRWIFGVGFVCCLALVTRQVSRRRRGLGSDTAAVWGYLLVAVQAVLTVGLFLEYTSQGGANFVRYLLPAALAAGLLGASALRWLPTGRRGIPAAMVLGGLTWVGIQIIARSLAGRRVITFRQSTFSSLVHGMRANGLPAPTALVIVFLSLLVVAYATLVLCMWRLGADRGQRPWQSLPVRM